MRFSSIFTLGLVGAAYAAPLLEEVDEDYEKAVQFVKRQYPVLPCSHLTGGIHVIALGGANTEYQKAYGLLASLSLSILAAIPGSTNVSVPYNKVFASTNPAKLQPGAIQGGMNTLKAYTVQYHNSCPNTKIALIGYSSGGVILMNDICYGGDGVKSPQINPLIAGKYIVGSVVYGDATRAAGQPWNLGTCTNNGGTVPRQNNGLCYPFANRLQSYCDVMDQDCCVGTGYDPNVHFSYPGKYDRAATQFIVNAVAASGGT